MSRFFFSPPLSLAYTCSEPMTAQKSTTELAALRPLRCFALFAVYASFFFWMQSNTYVTAPFMLPIMQIQRKTMAQAHKPYIG